MSGRMALEFFCLLPLTLSSAQDYPAKPVRLIEPFGAGGGPRFDRPRHEPQAR